MFNLVDKIDFFWFINFPFFSSICLRGQFQCNSEKCNKSKIICPNNLIFTETSLSSCPKTCSNHLIWENCHEYRSGCDCPTDMIRDENVRLSSNIIQLLILFIYRQTDAYFLNIVHVKWMEKSCHMVPKLPKIVTNGL